MTTSKIKHWLISGDAHGRVLEKLLKIDPETYSPEETALILLGDAGLNFYLNKTDTNKKSAIEATGFTVYCVRGNHEARPETIPSMIERHDSEVFGDVYYEPQFPHIRYFKDGGVYWFGQYRTLVIGGAYSVDKYWRLAKAGLTEDASYEDCAKRAGWFKDEQLTVDERIKIEDLKGQSFNLVLTHTCPISWEPRDLFLKALDQSTVDNTMENWLDAFKSNFYWNVWLFGHYHDDRLIRPHVEMYYNSIEDLDVIMNRWRGWNVDWWLKKDPKYYST